MKKGKIIVLLFLLGVTFTEIASASVESNDTSSLMDVISPARDKPNKQCYCDYYCCPYCGDPTSWGTEPTYTYPTADPTTWRPVSSTYNTPEPSSWPTESSSWLTETTTAAVTWPPPTCPPQRLSKPEFTKTIYQSALPSWPIAGTTVHLGIQANTSDGAPLRYQLDTTIEFLTLSASQDIIFISNVADGAFVGPNNVMIFEVSALVIGDETRSSNAAVAIVFPRSTREDEAASEDEHS
ncbi:unnamed protein product [Orchesella dallaii]|uniref:Uncharacterized protein n=1 Tax=Orchesella dallaii TaxID=48710 RepID=A0ABP1Q4U0_9HEXA